MQKYLILLIALVLRIASPFTANLSYFVIAAYALLGRTQAIQALAFSWLFSMISPGLAADATVGFLGRYVVLASAAASVLFRSPIMLRGLQISRPILATLLLGAFLISHSLLFSPITDVSVLKALSWVVAATTLLAGWAGLTSVDRELLARQLFGWLIVALVCSLPLLLLPVGYLRNGTGFQGVLSHPQAFGPTMGLLGAWAGGRMLAEPKPTWGTVGLFGVFLTECPR